MEYKFQHGVIGGTFDKLHEGHKHFLRYAFSHAKVVYVTITSDVYTKIHKPHAALFTQREKHIREFLKKEHVLQRAKLVPIDDVYGITPNTNIVLDVIFATKDSLGGAEKVNIQRKKLGLPPLFIEVVPLVHSEIDLPLSATHMRKGFGKKASLFAVYVSQQMGNTQTFLLTEKGTYPYEFYKRIGFKEKFTAIGMSNI